MRNTNNKTITITHMQQFIYFHSELGDHLYAHRTHASLFISQDALFLQRANEKHLFRKQNLLPGSCNSSETFLASRKQILLPKEMFLIGPYQETILGDGLYAHTNHSWKKKQHLNLSVLRLRKVLQSAFLVQYVIIWKRALVWITFCKRPFAMFFTIINVS